MSAPGPHGPHGPGSRGPGGDGPEGPQDPRPTVKPTGYRDLVGIFVVVALLGNIVVRLIHTYGTMPGIPTAAGIIVGLLGLAELAGGFVLRRRLDGSGPRVPALVAARAVLLAKASSVGGAVIGGLWTAVLAYTLPRAGEVLAAAADSIAAGIGLVCALLLVGGGLWLEYCCRAPDDRDDDPPPVA
ncbi:DUF3180 domain-containing protein [Pseudonocardia phyllosphaerae]|uniref:DUF3180 domain-containing protein n=1 Tax=Pseudonocardia phyllosphaerae TaxID=3390502 RepID=UPI00397806FA